MREADEVLADGGLDRRVVGQERLEHDPARRIAAPGAAGDLRDELERPLGGAEVGQRQRRVAADDADERDVRVVQPLGDHLRAEHHLDLALGEAAEQCLVVLAAAHRVAVDAGELQLGELPRDLLLDALRAQAEQAELLLAARALLRQRVDRQAVVAVELAGVQALGERSRPCACAPAVRW